jgi:hypothetical protein
MMIQGLEKIWTLILCIDQLPCNAETWGQRRRYTERKETFKNILIQTR